VLVGLTGLDTALLESPVRLSTMGRALDQDPAYFLAAAAAGRHAATLIDPAEAINDLTHRIFRVLDHQRQRIGAFSPSMASRPTR
jgi:hypothetical protein